ncbi:hypothetical protein ACOSQ3_027336 [Xanthoceras sorbifolium]
MLSLVFSFLSRTLATCAPPPLTLFAFSFFSPVTTSHSSLLSGFSPPSLPCSPPPLVTSHSLLKQHSRCREG